MAYPAGANGSLPRCGNCRCAAAPPNARWTGGINCTGRAVKGVGGLAANKGEEATRRGRRPVAGRERAVAHAVAVAVLLHWQTRPERNEPLSTALAQARPRPGLAGCPLPE